MSEQVQAAAERFIDVLHRLEAGDRAAVGEMAALFRDDARLENAALELADEQRHGQAGARQFWSAYQRTFEQAHSTFHHITTSDRAAGLFWTTRGTSEAGQAIEYAGASLLVFDDRGQIQRFHGYYDTRELDRQVEPAALHDEPATAAGDTASTA